MTLPATLTSITEANIDLSGGFYIQDNGVVLNHEVNFISSDADKGFVLQALRMFKYLQAHLPAGALAELLAQNLTFTGTVTLGTGKHLNVASRTETRVLPVSWAPVGAGFEAQSTSAWKDSGTGAALMGTFRLPHAVTINELHFTINPKNGHGAVPTTPVAIVSSQAISGSIQTTIATCTDGSANAGAYDAVHNISATGLSVAVDAETKSYQVYLTGEFGGAAESDLVVFPWVKAVYTRTLAGED